MGEKSAKPGRSSPKAELTNITGRGFWLRVEGRELFVRLAAFPWFRDASIRQLLAVELPHAGPLYWPELDVDLAIESIEHPGRFPLVSKVQPSNTPRLPAGAPGPTRTPRPARAIRG